MKRYGRRKPYSTDIDRIVRAVHHPFLRHFEASPASLHIKLNINDPPDPILPFQDDPHASAPVRRSFDQV
jgi:hypothetical protein